MEAILEGTVVELFKTDLRKWISSSRSTKTQGRISRQNSTQQNSSGHSGWKSDWENSKIQKKFEKIQVAEGKLNPYYL